MRTHGSQDHPPTAALGAAVRTRRRQLGLRQAVLADLAGVGVAFLYDLEKGKPTLRIDKVLAVLGALGLGLTVGPSTTLLRSELTSPDGTSVAADGGDAP